MRTTAATLLAAPRPWTHGDAIVGRYVAPREGNPREFKCEDRPATIVGFSAPNWVVARNWGWLGSVLVRFEDGTQAWNTLYPRAA